MPVARLRVFSMCRDVFVWAIIKETDMPDAGLLVSRIGRDVFIWAIIKEMDIQTMQGR